VKTVMEQMTNEYLLKFMRSQIEGHAVPSELLADAEDLISIVCAMQDINMRVYPSDEYIPAVKKYACTALRTFITLTSIKDDRSDEIEKLLASMLVEETARLFPDTEINVEHKTMFGRTDESINGKGKQIVEELGG